jgi:hypothetical protein
MIKSKSAFYCLGDVFAFAFETKWAAAIAIMYCSACCFANKEGLGICLIPWFKVFGKLLFMLFPLVVGDIDVGEPDCVVVGV